MSAILSTLLWLVLAGSQDPASTAQAPPPATSEVRGRVTDKESGRPLARAVVWLARMDGTNGQTAMTDADGRFVFAGLTAGTYAGFADDGAHRAAHVTGSLLSADGLRTIVLKAGESLKDVDVPLVRALAITVRVVDEWGEPLSGLGITVKSATTGAQVHAWSPRTTDDRGRLRLFKLPPGRYIVCGEGGESSFVFAGPASSRDRLMRTCFPSVPDESQAERVLLESSDVDGLEIVMRRGRTYSISGVVLDASGAPAADVHVGFSHHIAGGGSTTQIAAGPDGRFVVGNIPPGDYAIEASVGGPERPAQRRDLQVAYQPVHVGSSDVEGLVVTMAKAVDVAGRFVLEDAETRLPRPDGGGLMVLARLMGDDTPGDGGTRIATADPDRVFRLTAMFGRRTFDFANVPRGWYVKSLRYAGKEIIDTATELKAGSDPSALEVVLSTRGAVVTGRVLDDAGNPVPGARVLVIEADPARRSTFLQTAATASTTGTFRTGPRRAGDYLVVAVGRDVEPPRPYDRDRMAALLEGAERITLAADEERALDVRIRKPM
jgi:Carboxypeptidase regulatory-like domain